MIELSKKEKALILSAIKIDKENHENYEKDKLEKLAEIEIEMTHKNILLSRSQLDFIITCLGPLLDRREEYNSVDVYLLESKLEELSNLP